MPRRNYTLYCDESSGKGRHYSNFYGGALVKSNDREAIELILREKKESLNISSEMKWTSITKNYQERYIEFVRAYFEFVRTGRLKIRIMFTHNYHRPKGLTAENHENQYFILYYQMIKHAFGFAHSNPNSLDRISVSVILDDLPDTKEKCANFKRHLASIASTRTYLNSRVSFPAEQIAGADSRDHTILQGLDIVLGSMHFRLNDLHKVKPEGQHRRGNRTIAKEAVYKEINRQIRDIYPNFNVGVSTGTPNGPSDRWAQPYRHWRFIPKDHEINEDAVKPR